MGLPKELKTDNGPGYTGKRFQDFYCQFSIVHKTGIPYNPQGQGIVERAHGTIKAQLEKIKKGELYMQTPQNILAHAPFIINFLILDAQGRSAAQRFWDPQNRRAGGLVRWRDPLTGD